MLTVPGPSPSPDAYTPPLSPEMAAFASLLVAAMVGILILFVIWGAWAGAEIRETRVALCICGHGRLEHKGYDDRFECRHCRCRTYIRKAPDKYEARD